MQGFERLEDLLVRRPHPVINFNEFPPNDALFIYHIGSRVRQSLALWIENAIAIDHTVIRVRQEGDMDRIRLAPTDCAERFVKIRR
jgi:hypothetical protein